jgi:predicted kinase
MSLLDYCPSPPDWTLDWDAIRKKYDWVDALFKCPQDPVFHAEGVVGIHTRMTCEALTGSDQFRQMAEEDRQILFAAAVLHDAAKPVCTKKEGHRITSKGHSNRGALMARRILWYEQVRPDLREAICGLIRFHQRPFFLVDRDDSQKAAFEISLSARCDLLSLLARADALGRECAEEGDLQNMLDKVALFREYCAEQNCLTEPRQFPSDHSRFLYFQKDDRDPDYLAYDDTKCEVILMSGLPGSGKDHWINNNVPDLPVVSLDDIRDQFNIAPSAAQGRVVEEGKCRARQLLRDHKPFVWNATNISRHLRRQLISLFSSYNAKVRIVYVEASADVLWQRNQDRQRPVPPGIMKKMINKWTIPDLTEAHEVELVLNG